MRLTWDEPKRLANLAKHGLDFADFETSFDPDTARVIGRHPSRPGGLVDIDRPMEANFGGDRHRVPLGTEALAIVSLRPASAKERAFYEQS